MHLAKLTVILSLTVLTGITLYGSRSPDVEVVGLRSDGTYEDGEKAALGDLGQGIKQYVVYGLVIDGRQIEKHLASYGLEAYFAGCVVSDWGKGYNDTVRRELGIRERISTLIALEPAVDL